MKMNKEEGKKKFNKKKFMLFGLPILALVLVTAGLVGYLSNKVTADIEVTSPMVAGISLSGGNWGGAHFPTDDWDYVWETELSTLNIHGGETITLYTMSENIADVEIKGFEEAIVTNLDGLTCGDFESIIVRVDSIYGSLGYGTPKDVIALGACFVIDNNNIKLGSPDDSTWGAGEADVSEIVATFKTDATGTYTFSYRVIPAGL